ncbi:concanavalin A-like lectin/glucanase domain-containing protein [Dactylonectria macrodidyma]|uniref:Concanavalin A-like lectin/glucanase domain-containing protein n=1 Tax=Dactylonectria macrodidyma TaxID=307937 RepID=A0A9P9EQB0_9HYPO|nr:concanavalin A-like lectin/glucanase domain-containing protein [Dactylonectria macrodidyma]
MRPFWFSLMVVLASGRNTNCARKFSLKATYDSTNFFDRFNFRDAAYYNSINPAYGGDPTNGSVNYLSKAKAVSSGIASTADGRVYLGVDSKNKAKLRGTSKTIHGRDSVRLESKTAWSSGLLIADIQHMPGNACGVWPSFWAYNFDEDPVGEIDIIEGINKQTQNVVSLHTCGACRFTKIGGIDGRPNCNNGGTESDQCEDGDNYDGCGNTMSAGSYGTAFNKGKGGVYATWLEADAIKIYWWSRAKIPADITAGKPDPSKWGKPASQFISGQGCNVAKFFKGLTIIINTTFCGDNINQEIWDDECKVSTGAKTCDSYVTNNPKAFREAYWVFNSIKIYQ